VAPALPIALKRAYETAAAGDGCRILVERLWPRGVTKEAARIDLWAKEAVPTADLRKWYGHEPERWPEFQKRYLAELQKRAQAAAAVAEIRARVAAGPVTFVFAAKDLERNSAALLRRALLDGLIG